MFCLLRSSCLPLTAQKPRKSHGNGLLVLQNKLVFLSQTVFHADLDSRRGLRQGAVFEPPLHVAGLTGVGPSTLKHYPMPLK